VSPKCDICDCHVEIVRPLDPAYGCWPGDKGCDDCIAELDEEPADIPECPYCRSFCSYCLSP
jgi:hypothetical protein